MVQTIQVNFLGTKAFWAIYKRHLIRLFENTYSNCQLTQNRHLIWPGRQ